MHSLTTIAALNRQPRRSSKDRDDPQRIVRLEIETTPQVVALLDRLAASGLYPPTRAGVAEEVLRTALREIEDRRRP